MIMWCFLLFLFAFFAIYLFILPNKSWLKHEYMKIMYVNYG